MQNRHSYLWKTGIIVLCGGGLYVWYAYQSTCKSLDQLIQTQVMDYKKKKADYIYLSEMKFHPLVSAEGGINDEPLIINAINNWWATFKSTSAWRHLNMAQNSRRLTRLRAVRHLAKVNLTDSDYRMLAQSIDARTAVGLGRLSHSDLRFFLPPPTKKHLHLPQLKDKLMEFMADLQSIRPHACLSNFLLNRKRKEQVENNEVYSLFPEFDEESILKALDVLLHQSNVPGDGEGMMTLGCLPLFMELYYAFQHKRRILQKVFALVSNVTVDVDKEERLRDFFQSGWIGVLVQWSRESDARLSLPCHRALANLDLDEPYKYDREIFPLYPSYQTHIPYDADVIFVHGLLGAVHYTWRSGHHPENDHIVPVPTKAQIFLRLLKMDKFTKEIENDMADAWNIRGHDFEFVLADLPERAEREQQNSYSYPGLATLGFGMLFHVFTHLYPVELAKPNQHLMHQSASFYRKLDWVREVFEHEESTTCWPRDWLPRDCPRIRVLGINYTSGLSLWLPQCPDGDIGLSLTQRSHQLMRMLLQAGVGERPIIWVTHSMGGLVVKSVLVHAFETAGTEFENLYRNTRGIAFLTVPHLGSEIADVGYAEFFVMPSIEVQELRYRCPTLVSLHTRFLRMVEASPMRILSFGETVPTLLRPMVKPMIIVDSTSSDPGIGEYFEIPLNHMDVCKPSGRHSFIYRKLVEMVRECSKQFETIHWHHWE